MDEQRIRVILDAEGEVEPEMEAFLDKGSLLATLLDRRLEVTVG